MTIRKWEPDFNQNNIKLIHAFVFNFVCWHIFLFYFVKIFFIKATKPSWPHQHDHFNIQTVIFITVNISTILRTVYLETQERDKSSQSKFLFRIMSYQKPIYFISWPGS